ncbi:hypothetical protein M8C21_004211 [Ambrosia artemisiifolia]|uniref:TF-B3 domain-containing protein n=1 Tax=Ambrosia artemisiifolia TaxID=4212 RepID=A0AAD5CLI5_AMBAR|nr:hypothetical protein M8C21_004211 [Ambrosia artemisiifolia]
MKMNFKKQDEASFYQILLSDSEYLPLPSAFAKKYLEKGDNKKHTIVLKTESGVEWRVKYIRIEDRFYFMGRGWLKFMKDNRLLLGDFMVFWLRSCYSIPVLEVFIYSPNGCLKNTNGSDDTRLGNEKKRSVKEETSDGDSLDNVRPLTMSRIVRKCYMYKMPLTKAFVKASGINYGHLQLENEDGKMWDATLEQYSPNQIPVIGTGWSEFVKDNKLKIGNSCTITHVKDNFLRVNKKRRRPNGFKSKFG